MENFKAPIFHFPVNGDQYNKMIVATDYIRIYNLMLMLRKQTDRSTDSCKKSLPS